MIPNYIMQIEELPVTVNGKVDRKELPEIDNIQAAGSEYEAPRSNIEEKLVKIWRDVLVKESISINDNFFDLGGHSLKATTIINRVNSEFDIRINVKELFENPTIKTFNKVILTLDKKQCLIINKCREKKEYYKASSAEKRVFALWEMDKSNIVYNIPVIVEIYEKINKEKIENILNKLIQRHEALRTSFYVVDGEIVQKIEENWQLDFKYEECNETIVKEKIRDFIRPFDLKKAPLMRCKLIKTGEKKYIFMVDFHHIATDGVSISILMKEFIELYRSNNLAEPVLQYKDFSEWQNSFDEKGELKEQEEYWLNRFKGDIPILNIESDYERPSVKNHEGYRINFTADKELTEKLNHIAKNTETTLYLVLLASYNVMLSKYSGQEDIVIGTAQAGRPYAEIENVVGMFVNTIALRNYPNKDKTFREFLIEVKNNTLRDFENSDYQFEKLIKKLDIKRDTSRNPLFDVMFLLEDMDFNSEAEIKLIQPEFNISKFDLTLTAAEIVEGIKFNLEYCIKLFENETIERMKEHFINILNSITDDLDIKIKDINIISDEKRELYINDMKKVKNVIDELEFDF
ncbi:gramicidin S synthase 2 [Clostridium puniceum]|uniref:Gramicidin S synthase 2 n=2 Tax=Clostridium puniceum TaxID=29367 RepID=A0A1S8TYQ1_9CLOT|nr:gramicidin S synthase 2 [Clostridium puniceum]